ncbi:MAG: ATP-binding cassette domain-containing protein [Acidimicrobiales bacterium]
MRAGWEERPIILLDGLHKHFGGVVALDGLDLEVERGTVLGLLGPNGSGKTTTVRILATLLSPDSGYAEVAGISVTEHPAAVRALIGLTGQQVAIDEHLTARENLAMVARLRHVPGAVAREQVDDLIERLTLGALASRVVRTLSGGTRRRLDLAVSLLGRPRVLVLDEPTTGLDPQSRFALWEVIEDLVRDGTTVLLTTQYLEEADRLATKIAVIDAGRVVAHGRPEVLKAAVGTEVIELVLHDAMDVAPAAAALESLAAGGVAIDLGARVVRLRASQRSTIIDTVRCLDAAGVELEDARVHNSTLDDVFLALTHRETAGVVDGADVRCLDGQPDRAVGTLGPMPERPSGAPWPHACSQGDRECLVTRLGHAVQDTVVIVWRNLLRYVRLPNLLVFSTVQPIMFVLMFNYVFGGVIKLTVRGPYIDFLMPGIFVQAVVFGSTQTGVALADDLSRGMVDRFRSLPMARLAVLMGRTLADGVRNLAVLVIMAGVGTAIGFRLERGLLPALAATGLALAFGLSFSWLSAVVGLVAGNVEAAQAGEMTWILPVVFASSAFVPVTTMPGWLQAFSKADPVTLTVDAMRGLVLGGPVEVRLVESLLWVAAILGVCLPYAVWRYHRLT